MTDPRSAREGLPRHYHQSFASRDACESCTAAMAAAARDRAALAAPEPGLDVERALDLLGGMWSWNENGIPEDWNGWVAQAGRILEGIVGRHAREPEYAALRGAAEPPVTPQPRTSTPSS